MKRMTYGLIPWTILILLCSVLTQIGFLSPISFAKPYEIAQELVPVLLGIERPGWAGNANFWLSLFATGRRVFVAAAISFLVGVPMGLAIGRFKKLRWTLEPLLNFLRGLPVTTLYPLFFQFFGYFADDSKIAMAALGSGLVMIVSVYEGVANCDREIIEAAMLDGAGEKELIRHVVWYLALPYIYTGFRIGLSLAMVIVIVAEVFMGGGNGLGYVIYWAAQRYNIPQMWTFILLTGMFGLLINTTLEKLKPRLIPWL